MTRFRRGEPDVLIATRESHCNECGGKLCEGQRGRYDPDLDCYVHADPDDHWDPEKVYARG